MDEVVGSVHSLKRRVEGILLKYISGAYFHARINARLEILRAPCQTSHAPALLLQSPQQTSPDITCGPGQKNYALH